MRKWPIFQVAIVLFIPTNMLWGLPEGATVVAGTVEGFDQTTQTEMSLSTRGDAIVNWDRFSVRSNEKVHFQMPDKHSRILNRVTGKNSSEIFGQIQSNGQVFLMNPYGLVIGPHARIETAAFIASTFDVLDKAFLEKTELLFRGDSEADILQQGVISCDGGDVVLIARKVLNEGTLKAHSGAVCIGCSHELLYKMEGRDRMYVRRKLDEEFPVEQEFSGEEFLTQTGWIEALQVELKSLSHPHAIAIRNSGVIHALGVEERNGEVYLVADQGLLLQDGIITAKNEQKGGEVRVLGKHVHLSSNSVVDVDGMTQGGTILLGDDRKETSPLFANCSSVVVEPQAQLKAGALVSGNGGRCLLWSEQYTSFQGDLSIRGGIHGGNGGFAEISSLGGLLPSGTVSALAPHGKIGELLLDPCDVTISVAATSVGVTPGAFTVCPGGPISYSFGALSSATINNGDLGNYLDCANVTINTGIGGGAGTGTVSINNDVFWSSATTLTLIATGPIRTFGGTVRNNNPSTGFTAIAFSSSASTDPLTSDAAIRIDNALTTDGGNISLNGIWTGAGTTLGVRVGAAIQSTGGAITVQGTSTGGATSSDVAVLASSSVQSSTGSISILGNGSNSRIQIFGNVSTGSGTIQLGSPLKTSSFTISATVSTTSGNINIYPYSSSAIGSYPGIIRSTAGGNILLDAKNTLTLTSTTISSALGGSIDISTTDRILLNGCNLSVLSGSGHLNLTATSFIGSSGSAPTLQVVTGPLSLTSSNSINFNAIPATLTATGAGNISLNAIGSSPQVSLGGATAAVRITSQGGNISISALPTTPGGATVVVNRDTRITTNGTGTITMQANNSNFADDGFLFNGISALPILIQTVNGNLNVNSLGNVICQGGSAAGLQFGCTGSGAIGVNLASGSFSSDPFTQFSAGSGGIAISAAQSGVILDRSTLTTTGIGSIQITGHGDLFTAFLGETAGIQLKGAAISGAGGVTLTGFGARLPGIDFSSSTQTTTISASSSNPIQISGTSDNFSGVKRSGILSVTAVGGAISISGTTTAALGNPSALDLAQNSYTAPGIPLTITTQTGAISLTGSSSGTQSGHAIHLGDATGNNILTTLSSSTSGDISLTGTTTGSNYSGLKIDNSTVISTLSVGTVSLSGTNQSGGGAKAISVIGPNVSINSQNGLFSINSNNGFSASNGALFFVTGSGFLSCTISSGPLSLTGGTSLNQTTEITTFSGDGTFTIGGDLILTGGTAAGTQAKIGIKSTSNGYANFSYTVGGSVTVSAPDLSTYAIIGGGNPGSGSNSFAGAISLNVTGGGINLLGASGGVGSYGFAQIGHVNVNGMSGTIFGDIDIECSGACTITGGSANPTAYARIGLGGQPQGAGFRALGDITLLAGTDVTLVSQSGLGEIAGGRNVSVVVDNLFPTSPSEGPGAFSVDANSLIDATAELRIYSSKRAQNTINGQLNGTTYVPGPFGVDTPTERWGVYYPSSFYGGEAYCLFYKEGGGVPPTPPTPPTPISPSALIARRNLAVYDLNVAYAQLDLDFPFVPVGACARYNGVIELKGIDEDLKRKRRFYSFLFFNDVE